MAQVRETFLRPPEVGRNSRTLPADLYNRCRLLLAQADHGCLFVPLRGMQFLAVLDREELIFVDSQEGPRWVDGQGGRPMLMSWRFPPASARHSLNTPVPCEMIHYRAGLEALEGRLIGELNKALIQLQERLRPRGDGEPARLLPFS